MGKPNLIESYQPCSGQYSLRKDLRLNAWLLVATVVYVAMLLLLKRNPEWSPLTRGLLMLTPLVPGLLYLRSWIRLVRGMDELQRRIQMEASLFAALGTVIIGVVLNTLNASGVNLGVRQSPDARVILVLNPDVVLHPKSVPPLLAALNRPDRKSVV